MDLNIKLMKIINEGGFSTEVMVLRVHTLMLSEGKYKNIKWRFHCIFPSVLKEVTIQIVSVIFNTQMERF
jgi:hypothetical protein